MNEIPKNKSIREQVLAKIKNGRVKMLPKWRFILKTVLAIIGIAIIALSLIYLASFIVFILHKTGAWFVPIFGIRGINAFLISLPWLLIFIAAVFIILLEILVKRYAFAYQKPLLYSLFIIILLVALGGLIVSRLGFHEKLFQYAEEKKFPIGGPFYHEYGMRRFRDIHEGIIMEMTDNGFRIKNRRGETLDVIIQSETRFPLGINFATGMRVVVFGPRENTAISAMGIRSIANDMHPPPRRQGWPKPFAPRPR